MTRLWNGRLAHYRSHRHPEHLEALLVETMRFVGLQLEVDLQHSEYWSRAPLIRRAPVLLFLIDRGLVTRQSRDGLIHYLVAPNAEAWIASQPALSAYLLPSLELISALRHQQARRLLQHRAS